MCRLFLAAKRACKARAVVRGWMSDVRSREVRAKRVKNSLIQLRPHTAVAAEWVSGLCAKE